MANIAETISGAILETVESNGVSLWDVQYLKEGSERILRITIDKPEGISINDCERVHRAVEKIIDELDPIKEHYCLETSSPGLGRRLTKPAHFAAKEGEEVEIRLIRPDELGNRSYFGKLISGADPVVIDTENGRLSFAGNGVSFVKLCDDSDLF